MDSAKAVAMPMTATTHIQNRAPGPPATTARATPATLPMPTRAASPTAKAWKEEMPPSAPEREPVMVRIMVPNRRTWTPRVRTVKYSPTTTSRAERA